MFKNATQIRNINKSDIVKKIPYRFDLVDFVFCIVKIGSSAFILSLFSKFLTFAKFQKTPKFYSTFKPEAIDSFESLLKIIEELKDK